MTTFDGWGCEELRRTALVALGAHADKRAVDALRRAVLNVAHGVAHWQSSTGPVRAHRVTLGLEARCLGQLRAAPATADSLCAAFAAAIAARPGETLLELVLQWMPDASIMAAYRDTPRPPVSLREALVDYLEALGEWTIACAIAVARVAPEYPSPTSVPARIIVELDPANRGALMGEGRAIATLTDAVRDLLGDARTRLDVT